ncbi:MAG: (Na+)-NQR maturation NqrM [Zetaproteobacteria bacterium]|nr:(Na+)-NQR maturation NqrM [Zetaproteobacteria bacterium]
MGIGVLFRRRPLSGSCGGLNNALQDEQGSCQICGAQVDESCKNKIESYDTPRKLD